MKLVWLKRSLVVLMIALVVVFFGLYLIVSTESGTRWMIARIESFLPQQLQLEGISGSLLAELHVDELIWRDTDIDVAIGQLSLSAELRPLLWRHVSIESLSVQSVGVVARQSSNTSTESEPLSLELPLRISVDAAELRNLSVTTAASTMQFDFLSFAGNADGTIVDIEQMVLASDWLQLNGRARTELGPPYDVRGNVDWVLDESIDATPLSGTLEISGTSDAYQVNHSLTQPFEIQTIGTLRFAAGTPQIDLSSEWDSLRWPLNETQTLLSSGGGLTIVGGSDRFNVDGLASVQLNTWPEFAAVVQGQGSSSQFELALLRLESELGNLAASGNSNWADEPNWTIDFNISELQLAHLQEGLAGSANAAGSLTGSIPAAEELELAVEIDSLSGTVNEHPLEGQLAVTVRNEVVAVAESWVAVGRNRIDGRGRLAPSADLALRWELQAVEELFLGATGISQGQINVQQDASVWELDGNVSAADLSWQDYRVASLVLNGSFSTGGAIDGVLQANNFQFQNQLVTSLTSQVTGSLDDHNIELDIRSNDRTLSLRSAGVYIDEHWNGELDSFEFVDGERTTWLNERVANLALGAGTVDVDICLREAQSAGRLCVDANLNTERILQVNSTVENLPLARLPVNLLSNDIDLDGSVDADVALTWQDQRLNGAASAQLSNAAIKTNYDGEEMAASFDQGAANATVTDNRLEASASLRLVDGGSAQSSIMVNDLTDGQSSLAGSASLELTNLAFLPLLVPAVSDTSGTISGTLNVGGILAAPKLGGDLRLDNGRFRANSAGVTVSGIAIQLRQADAGQLTLEGSARSGDGQVFVTGDSRIDPSAGLLTAVTITGDNFEFVRLPEWQAVASPDIRINLDNDSAIIRGSLNVPRAKVTLQSLPETAERASPDAIVHGREAEAVQPARRFDLDVETTLGDSVELSGFGLETRLAGALRLSGSSSEPFIGIGRIELHEGRYEAYGQELDIENGALIFSGSLTNPTLDVRATRQVSDVVAGLQLSGTPNDLRSTVFSEPVLSDAEALSYLIAGRPLAVADDEESNRVGKAAFALGVSGAEKVIAQVQSKLGLDSLSLDSSDDVGRIVAGRRVGGRLLVEYGYGLVDRLGTLLLRYQLNDRIVVETTTGTASTLDVVYSVKKN